MTKFTSKQMQKQTTTLANTDTEVWQTVSLSMPDYKVISEKWLLNHIAPITVRAMNLGERTMKPSVKRAIQDYVKTRDELAVGMKSMIDSAQDWHAEQLRARGLEWAEADAPELLSNHQTAA